MSSTNLRNVGLYEILSRVYTLGRKMHPGNSLGTIKLNLQMLSSAVSHRDAIGRWYGNTDLASSAQFHIGEPGRWRGIP